MSRFLYLFFLIQSSAFAEFLNPTTYVAVNGDDIGSRVMKFNLKNDIVSAQDLSQKINDTSQMIIYILSTKPENKFELLLCGGADLSFMYSSNRLNDLENIRKAYKEITGATLTIGVGNSLSKAIKSLSYGKLTGKNRLVIWEPNVDAQLNALEKKTLNDKVLLNRKVYISLDGDNIGSGIGKYSLKDNIIEAKHLEKSLQNAYKSILNLLERKKNPEFQFILHGGDDLVFTYSSAGLNDIEYIRNLFKDLTGFSATVGIGNSIADSVKALLFGKLTGKNKLVIWKPSYETILNQLKNIQFDDKVKNLLS